MLSEPGTALTHSDSKTGSATATIVSLQLEYRQTAHPPLPH